MLFRFCCWVVYSIDSWITDQGTVNWFLESVTIKQVCLLFPHFRPKISKCHLYRFVSGLFQSHFITLTITGYFRSKVSKWCSIVLQIRNPEKGELEIWQLVSVWIYNVDLGRGPEMVEPSPEFPCSNYLLTTVGQSSIWPTSLVLLLPRPYHLEGR